jgi:hypothetical protein
MSSKKQPTAAQREAVANAFDPNALRGACETDSRDFPLPRYDLPPTANGRHRFYYFHDNGADILAVAHLDTVQPDTTLQLTDTAAGLLATSGGLDDRLGVYVITSLLPALGIHTDILLTTDEEMGQSTAFDFDPARHKAEDFTGYRWMFEFDRAGTDVVSYQYESTALDDLIRQSGAQPGQGSYSDIADLDHLHCAGVNWGVGYHDYHSERSHAWLDDTFRSVARFQRFYAANSAAPLPEPDEPAYSATAYGTAYPDYRFDPADDEIVADCGHYIDLSDILTYHDVPESNVLVCYRCGLPDPADY